MKEHIGYATIRHTASERVPDDEDDLPPMTAEELERAPKVPRVKSMRRALGLTQEQFAARYGIPLGTLRDWEQGVKEPDTAAKSYLRCIMGDAEGVARAFTAIPAPPRAG
jgi:putative transcriptional regulator